MCVSLVGAMLVGCSGTKDNTPAANNQTNNQDENKGEHGLLMK